MEKQELQAIQELYNLIHQWREKYTVGWINTSQNFKLFYRGVNHLIKSLKVLTRTEYLPCMTIEEKVANAVFYVESNGDTYRINFNIAEERYFSVINEDTGEDFCINYDNVPASSYFLGTVRL